MRHEIEVDIQTLTEEIWYVSSTENIPTYQIRSILFILMRLLLKVLQRELKGAK
jgi:hypothetical protein